MQIKALVVCEKLSSGKSIPTITMISSNHRDHLGCCCPTCIMLDSTLYPTPTTLFAKLQVLINVLLFTSVLDVPFLATAHKEHSVHTKPNGTLVGSVNYAFVSSHASSLFTSNCKNVIPFQTPKEGADESQSHCMLQMEC